ncbi:P-loop containing nucleoside triphosphate hydrolase protein [Aspergillus heterothallicus]
MLSLVLVIINKFFDLLNTFMYAIQCRRQGITKHAEVLITGPRNAGKTTLAHRLRAGSTRVQMNWKSGICTHQPLLPPQQPPTNVDLTAHLDHNSTRFTITEPGGLAAPPIFGFLRSANALIFMVDGSDYETISEARIMLDATLARKEIEGVPVVVFVNKIDRHHAVGPEEFMYLMGFADGGLDCMRRERAVEVLFGSIVVEQGIEHMIAWLAEHV